MKTAFLQTAGALVVNGALSSGTNSLTIQGGILAGTGSISASAGTSFASVTIGGTLSPGATASAGGNGIATLAATANITLTAGSHYAVDIDAAPGVSDLLALSGTGAIGGNLTLDPNASLDIVPSAGGPIPGAQYLIATYSGALSGTFANVTPGYSVSYAMPNEILVTAVPEPLAIGPLLAGALPLLARRRRHRRFVRLAM
jgi:hypothetical protein